jgi:hypothetical protein
MHLFKLSFTLLVHKRFCYTIMHDPLVANNSLLTDRSKLSDSIDLPALV